MYILKIVYRFTGKQITRTDYREFDKLGDAIDARRKWIELFKHDCAMFDLTIYAITNF